MNALWPRINQTSTHLMTVLCAFVVAGSTISFFQMRGLEPTADVSLAEIRYLYVWRDKNQDMAF